MNVEYKLTGKGIGGPEPFPGANSCTGCRKGNETQLHAQTSHFDIEIEHPEGVREKKKPRRRGGGYLKLESLLKHPE